MKSFLIIGMGTFGHHLCEALCRNKCEIMIVDQNSEAVEDMLPYVTEAKVADCTNIDVLKSFDVASFDACFVCVNQAFQACLEITDQLKELGAKRVYSKADRDLVAKFLRRCGADYIIYPERDAAERIAVRESSEHIFDFIALAEGCAICEIEPPKEWMGRSVAEVGLRNRYNLNLIAARADDERMRPVVDPGYKFNEAEHILVLGSMDDVRRVTA